MSKKTNAIIKPEKNSIYIINILCILAIFFVNIVFNGWICSGNRVFYRDDLYLLNSYSGAKTLANGFSIQRTIN